MKTSMKLNDGQTTPCLMLPEKYSCVISTFRQVPLTNERTNISSKSVRGQWVLHHFSSQGLPHPMSTKSLTMCLCSQATRIGEVCMDNAARMAPAALKLSFRLKLEFTARPR